MSSWPPPSDLVAGAKREALPGVPRAVESCGASRQARASIRWRPRNRPVRSCLRGAWRSCTGSLQCLGQSISQSNVDALFCSQIRGARARAGSRTLLSLVKSSAVVLTVPLSERSSERFFAAVDESERLIAGGMTTAAIRLVVLQGQECAETVAPRSTRCLARC
jgi:hypothetical protein